MAFTVKNWRNTATPVDGAPTPISEATLEDLERRVTDYADSIVPSAGTDPNALQKTLIDAKGDLLVGSASDTAIRVALPAGVDDHGSTLSTNPLAPSGLEWSAKSADYNIVQAGAVAGSGVSQAVATANATAINAAFGAAAADKRPCFIPPVGVFEHYVGSGGTGRLTLPSNLHVRGFGKGRSILRAHSSIAINPGSEIIVNANQSAGNNNITLENFEIDGNRDARGGVPWQPDPGGIGHMTIRATAGLSDKVRLLNMTMHHAVGVGTGLNGVSNLLVQGCEIYSNGRDGCSVLHTGSVASKNIQYLGNHIYDCGDDCVAVTSYTGTPIQNVVVANNILGDHPAFTSGQFGGHGVAVVGCFNAVVANNVLPNCAYGAVQVTDGFSVACPVFRVLVANNAISLAGSPHSVADLGYGIEVTGKFGGAISDLTIANNSIQQSMSHAVYMAVWSGGGTISRVRVVGNDLAGGFGSIYFSGAGGVVAQSVVNFVDVHSNRILDMRGKGITGTNNACLNWSIRNNEVIGCENSTAGGGGPAIDVTNFISPILSSNRVQDFASPKNQSHAVGWGGAQNPRLFTNDFAGAGRTGTTLGSPAASLQANNVDNGGVLRAGNAAAGTI